MFTLNKDIIRNNIKKINNPFLVLKDNAYNFGFKNILDIAKELNIDMFAVNNLNEANEIIQVIKNAYILLISPCYIPDKRFIYSVGDMNDFMFCLRNKLRFHYEVNISMNRFGFNDINNIVINNYLCEGIFFHSNNNDPKEDLFKFEELLKKVERKDLIIHVGGSKLAYIDHPYLNRVGEILYDDAYILYGKIIKKRMVKKGEYIGYKNKYKAKKDICIGIVNVGYKDGLLEDNVDSVVINNKIYYTVGFKCMDYSFLIIDDNVNVDDLVLFKDYKHNRSNHKIFMDIKKAD